MTMTWSTSGDIQLFLNGKKRGHWKRKSYENMISNSDSLKMILGKKQEYGNENERALNIKIFSLRLHHRSLKQPKIRHYYESSQPKNVKPQKDHYHKLLLLKLGAVAIIPFVVKFAHNMHSQSHFPNKHVDDYRQIL